MTSGVEDRFAFAHKIANDLFTYMASFSQGSVRVRVQYMTWFSQGGLYFEIDFIFH